MLFQATTLLEGLSTESTFMIVLVGRVAGAYVSIDPGFTVNSRLDMTIHGHGAGKFYRFRTSRVAKANDAHLSAAFHLCMSQPSSYQMTPSLLEILIGFTILIVFV